MTTPTIGTIFVTGGASGLGEAVALAVRDAGGNPAVMDINPPRDDLPWQKADLSDGAATAEALDRLVEQVGPPDAVVTAAGTDCCGPLDKVPAEEWDRVIKVNLIGTAAVVRAALPHLRQRHGRVVTVGSTLGLRPAGDATAYCASKYGVVGFTRALAMELAGEVGVTMLVPAGMQTHFFDGRDPQYQPGPDAHLMDPADVASAVLLALRQPPGTEVRELIMTSSTEPSWP
jgi:NAD(P)-dependent dehydrogenase (short-subunit alcohol dehydrogenase family)